MLRIMLRTLTALAILLSAAAVQAGGLDQIRLGMQAERNHDWRGAIRHYTMAVIARDLTRRQRAGAHYNRGLVYARLGNTTRAIADYDRGLKYEPKDGIGYYYRGLAYEKRGDRRHARADFRRAFRHGYRAPRLAAKLKAYDAVASLGEATDAHGTVWVTRDATNVRRGPSTRTDRVATLPEGATVTVVGTDRRKGWHRVSRHGRVLGYVYAPLLKRVR